MITDTDILKVEPSLFSDDCFESQKLSSGLNGIVAGTQFTSSGVDFTSAGIGAGHVIKLVSADGAIDGVFEIVSVIDSTHLTVSVLRSDPAGSPVPVGSASGLNWEIKTYAPQIYDIEQELSFRLRCTPGYPASGIALDEIDNPAAVKRAWLYLLLAMLYGTLYASYPPSPDGSSPEVWGDFQTKSTRYRRCAERMIVWLG